MEIKFPPYFCYSALIHSKLEVSSTSLVHVIRSIVLRQEDAPYEQPFHFLHKMYFKCFIWMNTMIDIRYFCCVVFDVAISRKCVGNAKIHFMNNNSIFFIKNILYDSFECNVWNVSYLLYEYLLKGDNDISASLNFTQLETNPEIWNCSI